MADSRHTHHHHHHHYGLLVRGRYFLHVLFKYLSKVPLALALFLLGIFPIFYFGGGLWWQWLVLLLLIFAYGFWAISNWWLGGNAINFRPLLVFFLLPFIYGLFQLLPCPALVRLLSPKSAMLLSSFDELGLGEASKCLSLAPDATFEKLGIIFVSLLFFTLICSYFRKQLHLTLLMWALSLGALLNATLAFMQNFMGKTGGMASIAPFSGTFINRNHFGFLMMIGILSAVGLLVINTSSTVRERRAAKDDGRKTRPLFNTLLSIFIFIEFSALVLSQSRGAFIGVGVSLLVFFCGWVVKERHKMKDRGRQILLALVALTVSALLFALPFAMERLSERYKTLLDSDLTMNDRVYLWRITLRYIGDFWKTGSGIGSYCDLIERYEEGRLAKEFIDHAHNDYLELAAECGLPLTCVLLALLLVAMWKGFKRVWHSGNVTYCWCGWAAVSTLVGCMVHELFEFNMQAWTNVLAVTSLLAVVSITCQHGIESEHEDEATHDEIRRNRFKWRLPILFLGIVILCFVPPCVVKTRAAINYSTYKLRSMKQNIFWSPGRKDYLRRIGVLNSVEKDLPCFRVESKLALLYANLAGLDRGAAGENWRKACDYAAMAMRHAPMDGNFAVLGAEIFSRANASGARMDSDYSRLKLFLWAYQCIPSKQKALESTAIEAFKYYAKALSIFPEEVPEARQRALGLLVQCIKNNPSSCRKYIPFIAQASENEAQLMELCSDSVEVRLALAQYFAGMGNYSTSLKIMNQLLAGNGPDTALEYEDEYRLLDRRCGIYRLKGDEERWRLDVEKMKKLCHANKMKLIEEALALVKKAGNQEVVLRLEPLEYINPALPEYIILLAQQYKILGKNSDCLHLLLRLSYVERPLDIKFLLEARDLFVTNDKYHALESEVLRSFFLDAAIEIMLSEKGHASNVHKAINNLERLEGTYQSNSWLQFHLIPFYIARGYECIKEQEKAIEAYRRALKISPNNLYVLRRLGNLTREGLADKQTEILDFANKCKRPLSRVTPNLTFLGFKTSPEFVEALHSNVKLDVMMLCTSDIKAEYHFNMVFKDKKGKCFAKELDWNKTATPMVSWRVGEVYSHEYEWQPHTLALKGASRTLEPGDVSVSVSVSVLKQKLRPMPSIVERLWKVK